MINKYALLLLVIPLKMIGLSQTNSFELNGRVHGIDMGFVKIWSNIPDSVFTVKVDRVPLINGKFIIKGQLAYPSQAYLSIDSQNKLLESRYFFVDLGKQDLMIDVVNDNLMVTSSGNTFNENINYKIKIDFFDKIENNINRKYDSISNTKDSTHFNSTKEDRLLALKTTILNQKNIFLLEYIQQNPGSYMALSQLWRSIYFNGYSAIYDSAFCYINKELQLNWEGRNINKMLQNTRQFNTGTKFPVFHLLDTGSSKVLLNQINVKEFTLLDFWFHSCGACIQEFPALKNIYQKWQKRGFEIIGISTDLSRFEKEWKRAITKFDLSWPQYWDYDHIQSSELLINFFPTNFLINKEGTILAKNIRLPELDKFLEANLNKVDVKVKKN